MLFPFLLSQPPTYPPTNLFKKREMKNKTHKGGGAVAFLFSLSIPPLLLAATALFLAHHALALLLHWLVLKLQHASDCLYIGGWVGWVV